MEENPKSAHKEEILKQIGEAVKELSGTPEAGCQEWEETYPYMKDSTLNPFVRQGARGPKGPRGPKGRAKEPIFIGDDIGDGTLNPFIQEGSSLVPRRRGLSANISDPSSDAPLPSAEGTLNPFLF